MYLINVVRETLHELWTVGDKLRAIYLEATPKERVEADRSDTRKKILVYTVWCFTVCALEIKKMKRGHVPISL